MINSSREDSETNLSNTKREILNRFKENLNDILTPSYTDSTLLKWLRARNFDLKAAEKLFRQIYNNRILFGINTLVDTYEKPEVFQKYESTGFVGFAKDGSLIRYIAAGRVDFYGCIMSGSCFDLCLYFSYIMEWDLKKLKDESLRTGEVVDEVTYILDLEGFRIQQYLHKNVVESSVDFLQLLQDCYPEIWRRILVVNAPLIFYKSFNMFKHILRVQALEKMRVVNKESTHACLLEYIADDVLPMFLGGKRVDASGDAMCREFLTFGGMIPEEFYGRNCRVPLSPGDEGVKCMVIGPRSVYNYTASAQEGGTTIHFRMRSENGSVSITVFYRKFEEGEDKENPNFPAANEYLDENDEACRYEIISISMRAQMHCTQEDMKVCLWRPGVYVLRLGNTGSWFSSRKVIGHYTLHPPCVTQQE